MGTKLHTIQSIICVIKPIYKQTLMVQSKPWSIKFGK